MPKSSLDGPTHLNIESVECLRNASTWLDRIYSETLELIVDARAAMARADGHIRTSRTLLGLDAPSCRR